MAMTDCIHCGMPTPVDVVTGDGITGSYRCQGCLEMRRIIVGFDGRIEAS